MIDKKVVLITDKNEKINHADISNRNLEGNNAISTKNNIRSNYVYFKRIWTNYGCFQIFKLHIWL